MMPQPFSLRIFVADGDPDGLRLVERSNWIGKALVFARKLYPEVRNRSEFQQTGVYLLLDGEGETIYIGEHKPVHSGPGEAIAGSDILTRVVFFTACGGQLNTAHAQFLVSRLVALAKKAKKVKLKDCAYEPEPMLSIGDRADMDEFLQNMLVVLPAAGVNLFDEVRSKSFEERILEKPTVDTLPTTDAAKKREELEQAAKMEKFIRSLLKPSKRNLAVATCLGIVLVLIQCARVGYLPEFDWKSGAGAVALIGVLAVSIFGMLVLTLCVALPGLPMKTDIEGKSSDRYFGAVVCVSLWMAVWTALISAGSGWHWLNLFCENIYGVGALFVWTFGFAIISASFLAAKDLVEQQLAGWKTHILKTITFSRGLGFAPIVYTMQYTILAFYGSNSPDTLTLIAFLPAIVIMLVNLLILSKTATPAMYVAVGAFVFIVFCAPASGGAFSLLGLGGRTVEFQLKDGQYQSLLKHAEVKTVTDAPDTYRAYLRLRLGSELAISANLSGTDRDADIVVIPRDAIRGLRFVPTAPKRAHETKGTPKPAAENTNRPATRTP